MTASHPHASAASRVAFTLIELLIVVAIIAILAAIAVPNFLEAQTRSKISRSAADMRTVDTAIQAYLVDFNNEPKVDGLVPGPGEYSSWWGFVSTRLTTPIAYITSRPVMPFTDATIRAFWQNIGGSPGNQTYTMIRDTGTSNWPAGSMLVSSNAPAAVLRIPIPQQFQNENGRSGYIIYSGGPDGIDSTVWGGPAIYDPTNGTLSYGDIYRFAKGGSKDEGDRTN